MKRFYKIVSTYESLDGFEIHLDGKAVQTPAKRRLCVPTKKLADHIMQEWAAQDAQIDPETMPLTQIAVTAIDIVFQNGRVEMQDQLMRYVDTDLLCYRSSVPKELVEIQKERWDKVLKWFETSYGCAYRTTEGLSALSQISEIHDVYKKEMREMDGWSFTVFQMLVPAGGSIVLALAYYKDAIEETQFERACYAEEDHKAGIYNEAFYGAAPNQEKAREALKRDLRAARIFLKSLEN